MMKKLSKLKPNKSPGPDNLHSRVLNELQTIILSFLKPIFDHSFEYGILENWKTSIASPVFKKGKKIWLKIINQSL